MAKTLFEGKAPYHIDKFFKELAKDLPLHCDSKMIKKIEENIVTLYNLKLKKEKDEDKNIKKKGAVLKGGGGKGYDRNNNAAMIQDVMGADDLDDEDAGTTGFKRAEENDYDFM